MIFYDRSRNRRERSIAISEIDSHEAWRLGEEQTEILHEYVANLSSRELPNSGRTTAHSRIPMQPLWICLVSDA